MSVDEIVHRLALVADPAGRLAAYLAETSFYQDPASIRYHRCYAGGLADHSLGVFLNLRSLLLGNPSIEASDAKIARIALCHDLCKIGRYRESTKNVKDDRGVWQKVPCFDYAPARDLVLGHGDSSLFLAMRALGLVAPDVAMAIRFHMGAYDAAPGEGMARLSDAMTLSPLVILVQAADLMDTYQGETAEQLERHANEELKAAGILPASQE